MATGFSATVLNAWLDGLCSSTAWSEPAAFWVKLHLGDPGAAGAGNPAVETTRQQATFSSAVGGTIQTSANLTWTAVSTTETYTHLSFWDANAAGNFLGSDALEVSAAMTAGNDYVIPAGQLQLFVNPTLS